MGPLMGPFAHRKGVLDLSFSSCFVGVQCSFFLTLFQPHVVKNSAISRGITSMLKSHQKPTQISSDPSSIRYKDPHRKGVTRGVWIGVLITYGLGVLMGIVGGVWMGVMVTFILGIMFGFILWMVIPLLVNVLTIWSPIH